jgi:hypothetical protein
MLRPFPRGPAYRHQPGRSVGREPAPPAPSPEPVPVPGDAIPLEQPTVQPCADTAEQTALWFGRPSGPGRSPGFGPRPQPPTPSPCPPGAMPPLSPGAMPPPVPMMELAAAYVPFQQFGCIWGPGEIQAPGTIFPELARTPPLYRWPPCTDGRL